MTETYTRDSDGKKFKAEKFQYGMKTIGGFPNIQGSMKYAEYDLGEFYRLEPIEENPMPTIEPGDCVQVLRSRKGWYGVQRSIPEYECVRCWDIEGFNQEFKFSDITAIRRDGSKLWEAKK